MRGNSDMVPPPKGGGLLTRMNIYSNGDIAWKTNHAIINDNTLNLTPDTTHISDGNSWMNFKRRK